MTAQESDKTIIEQGHIYLALQNTGQIPHKQLVQHIQISGGGL